MQQPLITSDTHQQCVDLRLQAGTNLRNRWQKFYQHGHKQFQHNQHHRAKEYFVECVRMSRQLLDNACDSKHYSGCEMLFMSSHNLAACMNQLQQASEAEYIISDMYLLILEQCQNEKNLREVRLDALAVLDKAVFSLASQLAYMGKLTNIQPMIEQTAQFAETTQSELMA